MIARFHDAGLEVILDVVYNHTAEGNELGPTLSFKGIDNASYYRLMPDKKRYYINDTGTGNTVNLSHPRVIQMVTDSLRYWVEEMHVDGFRFDLGTILAREPDGFNTESGFLKAVGQDPVLDPRQADRRTLGLRARRLSGRRVSAGLGRVERHIPRHGARFLARRVKRQSAGAALVRLAGQIQPSRPQTMGERQFRHRPRRLHSVRLRRVQRQAQRSEWRGRQGRQFIEPVLELRRRRADRRRGRQRSARKADAQYSGDACPCAGHRRWLLAGDEFGRTQNGNNNAYCQDDAISWVDWGLEEKNKARVDFFRKLVALRNKYPILRRSRFFTGEANKDIEVRDVTWINADGSEMSAEAWDDGRTQCLGMLMDGRAQATGIRKRGGDATLADGVQRPS